MNFCLPIRDMITCMTISNYQISMKLKSSCFWYLCLFMYFVFVCLSVCVFISSVSLSSVCLSVCPLIHLTLLFSLSFILDKASLSAVHTNCLVATSVPARLSHHLLF